MKWIHVLALLTATVHAAKGRKKNAKMLSVPLSKRDTSPKSRIIEKLTLDAPFEYLDFRATCIRSYDHIGTQCDCQIALNTPLLSSDDLIIAVVAPDNLFKQYAENEPHLNVPRYQCQVVHDAKVPTFNVDGHCQINVRPTVLRSLAEGKKYDGIPCETYLTRHPDYELEKKILTKGVNLDKRAKTVWMPLYRTNGAFVFDSNSGDREDGDGPYRGLSLTYATQDHPLYIAGCELHQVIGGSFCSCRISNVEITPDSWVICPPNYEPTATEIGPLEIKQCGLYYSPKYVNLKTSNPEEYSKLPPGTACHTFLYPPMLEGVPPPSTEIRVNPDHEYTSVPFDTTKKVTLTSRYTHDLTIECTKETHGCFCIIQGLKKGASTTNDYEKGMSCPSALNVKGRPHSDQCILWINPKILDLMVPHRFESTIQVNPRSDTFGSGQICYTSMQEPPKDKIPIELKLIKVPVTEKPDKDSAVKSSDDDILKYGLESTSEKESFKGDSVMDDSKYLDAPSSMSDGTSFDLGHLKGHSLSEVSSFDLGHPKGHSLSEVSSTSDTKGLPLEVKSTSHRKRNKKLAIAFERIPKDGRKFPPNYFKDATVTKLMEHPDIKAFDLEVTYQREGKTFTNAYDLALFEDIKVLAECKVASSSQGFECSCTIKRDRKDKTPQHCAYVDFIKRFSSPSCRLYVNPQMVKAFYDTNISGCWSSIPNDIPATIPRNLFDAKYYAYPRPPFIVQRL